MTRAWALAILFFALAGSAAFLGSKGFAIVWGIPALCLTLFGLARAAADDDEYERHEAREQEQPKTIERPAPWEQKWESLRPDEVWRSAAPIPPGEDVTVQIEGTYAYCITNGNGRRYADGRYTWTEVMNPGAYTPHDFLYFDAKDEAAVPFFENRPLHTYRFLYTGTGMHMEVFVRRHAAFTYYCADPRLTISIGPLSPDDQEFFRAAQEAEVQRQAQEHQREEDEAAAERAREAREREARRCAAEAAAAAKRERDAEELAAQRRERFRMIQVRYGDTLFAWRTDDAALARYAREHRSELLEAKRTKDIIRDYTTFNDKDPDFGEWLRIHHLDVFHRCDEVFFYRARAVAESLPKDYTPPQPPRPKFTPEERQAKFERYRERALERDRIQAEDHMAAVRQKLDLLRQFRDDLDHYDLDDDERDRLVNEFEADLLTSTEEQANGFKKL